jgi:dTDP-4-dehydrorhamnose 3,5-epimerase
MKVITTTLPEVLILEPIVFEDERGFLMESWNRQYFAEATGQDVTFVQDNHSRSGRNVLRGIHYQLGKPQGKLVRVVAGAIFDVAVDLRRSSPTFGRWVGVELSEDNRRQLWIPPGFGHGFLVRSKFADCLYKLTEYWEPRLSHSVRWNDRFLGIEWNADGEPILSSVDANAPMIESAPVFP